jgi:hypothetical protein
MNAGVVERDTRGLSQSENRQNEINVNCTSKAGSVIFSNFSGAVWRVALVTVAGLV